MKLHHTGWIVGDIASYEKGLLHRGLVHQVADPVQGATLALYRDFSDSYIELIQPLNEQAFTWAALQKHGAHFHHYCYEVPTVDAMREVAAQYRLMLFRGPLDALLFGGKPVYFYFSRNRTIVEFLIDPS